jgi:hypothetical protein
MREDILNDEKKRLMQDLLTSEGFYDKAYKLRITQEELDKINNEITPLYLGGQWFHNMVKKKYHKQYKSKKDAMQSYFRTV